MKTCEDTFTCTMILEFKVSGTFAPSDVNDENRSPPALLFMPVKIVLHRCHPPASQMATFDDSCAIVVCKVKIFTMSPSGEISKDKLFCQMLQKVFHVRAPLQ